MNRHLKLIIFLKENLVSVISSTKQLFKESDLLLFQLQKNSKYSERLFIAFFAHFLAQ